MQNKQSNHLQNSLNKKKKNTHPDARSDPVGLQAQAQTWGTKQKKSEAL